MAAPSTQSSSSNVPIDPRIEEFVFRPRQFQRDRVPRHVPLASLIEFTRTRIDPATDAKAITQLAKILDFYDAYETAPHLRKLLDRRENGPADVIKSAQIAALIARIGTPADRDFARLYFEYLVGRAGTAAEWEQLVDVVDALGPGAPSAPLRQKMQKRLADIEPHRSTDYKLELEHHKLQELVIRLDRADKANATKDKIIKIPDRPKRLDEEVRTHLGIKNGYPEYLRTWSARRLRRETWAPEPPAQFARADQPPLREQLAEAFDKNRREAAALKDYTPAEKENWDLICLQAIVFFGGSISLPQWKLVKEKAPPRNDTLSNE